MVPVGVDVDRLAREHHGRDGLARERQQPGRVLGPEAGAVDEQVGALPERLGQLGGVAPVGSDEPSSRRSKVGREVAGIATREIDLPAGTQKAPRRRAADRAGPTENERAARQPSQSLTTEPSPRLSNDPRSRIASAASAKA